MERNFIFLAEIHSIDLVTSEVGEAIAQVAVEPNKTVPEESISLDISSNDDKGALQSNKQVQILEIETINSHSHLQTNTAVDM